MTKLTLEQMKEILKCAPVGAESFKIVNNAFGAFFYSEFLGKLNVWNRDESKWEAVGATIPNRISIHSLKSEIKKKSSEASWGADNLPEQAHSDNLETPIANAACSIVLPSGRIYGTKNQIEEIKFIIDGNTELKDLMKGNSVYPIERKVGECSISEGGLTKLEYFSGLAMQAMISRNGSFNNGDVAVNAAKNLLKELKQVENKA